jgi:hypothetical protein
VGGASSGGAGAGGMSGGSGAGGAGGMACGDVGEACCTNNTCSGSNTCLSGGVCSCATSLFGTYILRTDGAAIKVSASAQTPVLDATTGQPLTGIVDIQDGYTHGCAALSGGTVSCWRTAATTGNLYGQLGDGATDNNGAIFRATQVLKAANAPLTDVKALAVGNASSACAITNGGQLYCWGDLAWAVNNGTALSTGYAQAITTDGATPLGNVVQASTGPTNTCAILTTTSSNQLWCWGYNGGYELGLGDTINRQYPTQIVGPVNPTKAIVGEYTYNGQSANCALDSGNVRCWGYNGYGGVGNNTKTTPITSPTLVLLSGGTTALSGVTDLFSSSSNPDFCSLRSGALWCWGNGYNDYAGNYGVTNIVAVGESYQPTFMTSDGVYHIGTKTLTPNCGPLQ